MQVLLLHPLVKEKNMEKLKFFMDYWLKNEEKVKGLVHEKFQFWGVFIIQPISWWKEDERKKYLEIFHWLAPLLFFKVLTQNFSLTNWLKDYWLKNEEKVKGLVHEKFQFWGVFIVQPISFFKVWLKLKVQKTNVII